MKHNCTGRRELSEAISPNLQSTKFFSKMDVHSFLALEGLDTDRLWCKSKKVTGVYHVALIKLKKR